MNLRETIADRQRLKKVVALAAPAALSNLLDMLQVLIDLLMVGRLAQGAVAVAAVGVGLQFLWLVFSFLTLFYVGTNALVSRFTGSGEKEQAHRATASLGWVALAFAFPAALAFFLWGEWLFAFLGAEPAVRELGVGYLHIIALAFPFLFVRQVLYSALSAMGDTKTPAKIKIAAILHNTALNYVLIFGHFGFPALGVEGAAIATSITFALESLLYLGFYMARFRGRSLFLFDRELVRRGFKVGMPSTGERIVSYFSFLFFTKLIADFGTAALAGYQVGLRIEGVAFMPGIGFTVAAMALVGQGLGAGKPDESHRDAVTVTAVASVFMGFLGLFMIAVPHWFVLLFTDDPGTVEAASLYLRIVGVSQVPLALSFVLSGCFRGAGDTRTPFRINLFSLWAFRIIPGYLAAELTGELIWVFVFMSMETFIKGGWLWVVFQKGRWKNVKV